MYNQRPCTVDCVLPVCAFVFFYPVLSDLLNAAKSTISEDIVIIRELLEKLEMGRVETISGAAGGIKFIPIIRRGSKESSYPIYLGNRKGLSMKVDDDYTQDLEELIFNIANY